MEFAHDPKRRLDFPVSFHPLPQVAALHDITLEEMIAALGQPMAQYDPGDPSPTERWAFEYSCGLQLVYEYVDHIKGGGIIADRPEASHALRHVPFKRHQVFVPSSQQLVQNLESELEFSPERRRDLSISLQSGLATGRQREPFRGRFADKRTRRKVLHRWLREFRTQANVLVLALERIG